MDTWNQWTDRRRETAKIDDLGTELLEESKINK